MHPTAACGLGESAFSPIDAAAPLSQLAGVLAAVIFTGMVLLVSNRSVRMEAARRRALIAMIPTFLGLLFTSFCFAVIAGEGICLRASAESIAASGLFAQGATATFYSLSWMLAGFEESGQLSDVAGSAVYVVAVLSVAQLAVTTLDLQQKIADNAMVALMIWGYVALGTVCYVLSWVSWYRARPAARRAVSRRMQIAVRTHPIRVSVASLAIYSVLSIFFFNFIAATTTSEWAQGNVPAITSWCAVAMMIGLLPATFAMLLTMPGRSSRDLASRDNA